MILVKTSHTSCGKRKHGLLLQLWYTYMKTWRYTVINNQNFNEQLYQSFYAEAFRLLRQRYCWVSLKTAIKYFPPFHPQNAYLENMFSKALPFLSRKRRCLSQWFDDGLMKSTRWFLLEQTNVAICNRWNVSFITALRAPVDNSVHWSNEKISSI